MKAPKNFYNTVDQRKLGLEDGLLPDVTSSDNGKILKVSGGKWVTGDDENTTIIANPEGTALEDLENLQIGDTIYAVNKPTFEVIRGIRLTIADGGEYRTDKPKVEFYDDAGNLMTYPAYTSSCDKSYAGNINLDQVCSVATSDAPGAFTYIFNADVVVSTYHLIKLTNAGSFAGDIAKNIKLELSSDGTNFSEIWSDPAIAWGGVSGASRMIDIKTGDISNTILPIVTSADNGKVLGVSNGVWDKTSIDVLPSPGTGSGAMLLTENGVWKTFAFPLLHILSGILEGSSVTVQSKYPSNTLRIRDYIYSNFTSSAIFLLKSGSSFTVFYLHEVDSTNNKLVFKSFDNHTIEFAAGSSSAEISTGTYT